MTHNDDSMNIPSSVNFMMSHSDMPVREINIMSPSDMSVHEIVTMPFTDK